MSHHEHVLTASAVRAVEYARQRAAGAKRIETEAIDLLAGLVAEESRAWALMGLVPGARAELTAVLNPQPDETGLLGDSAVGSGVLAEIGDNLAEILHEAHIRARRSAGLTDVGTEHLLWALAIVDSPASALLSAHRLSRALLESHLARPRETLGEPLEMGVVLNWQPASQTERLQTFRVLDASANRCREGLRVVEDYVRFSRNEGELSRQLKTLRHDLTAALHMLAERELIAARDTLTDVGVSISTAAEMQRARPADVLAAAFKRVEESLRSLEEFGKVVSGTFAAEIEQLRYRTYTLEQQVLREEFAHESLANQMLYLLLTQSTCRQPIEEVIGEAIAAGVRLFQIREKHMTDRELLAHARRVRKLTASNNALVIMNDRPDLAVLAELDGVHVGQDELSVSEARQILGGNGLIGVSTHSIEQARQAVRDGADYIGIGPTFPSGTKSFEAFPGLEFVQQVSKEVSIPAYAIGGIDANNIASVLAAGGQRVAVTGAIAGANDPYAAATVLLRVLENA